MSQRMGSRSTRSGLQLSVAVALALSALQAQAVGLGTIEVKSRLDQPFVAEIPLTLNDPGEANDLVVRLASPEAFERVGLERSNELSANLQFTVGKNARGQPVIRVTTPQRMRDPYVSFLIEADWGKGKMVREYTALLDPPHTASVPRRAISAPVVVATPLPAPVPAVAPPTTTQPAPTAFVQQQSVTEALPPEAQPVAPMPLINAASPEPVQPSQPQIQSQSEPQPLAAAPQPEPPPPVAPQPEPVPPVAQQPAPPPVAEQAPPPPMPAPAAEPAPPRAKAASSSVTVGHGDTLAEIAGKVRPSDVSVNRMMIALQRTNPDAFIHDNINLLKSGAVLRIPGSEQTQALTPEEANALVHEQVESWRQTGQPAPQLQPDEGAETAVAKALKPRSGRAAKPAEVAPAEAAADKTTTDKAPAAASDVPAAADAVAAKPAAARKPEPISSSATPRKPRGARLEIVPPVGNAAHGSQSGTSEGGSGSELRAQLAQSKEELAARNSEIGDLKSRVADLEKIQKDSQQLLTMKDSQMAAMQQRLAELEKKPAAAPAAAASAAAAPASAVAAAPASNGSVASASSAAMAATSAPTPTPNAARPPAAPAITQPVESLTPWYMQAWVLIGSVLLLMASLLGWMLRRPKAIAPAPRPRGYGNGTLAASLASARTPSPQANSAPSPQAVADAPAPIRETIADPIPAAPVAASKPYWTGPIAAVPLETAPSPAATPALSAAAVPAKHDEWAIDATPPPVVPAPDVTKVRAAVPELDDPSQTVATKLELARAYIDIGDSDGARGMLEEVLIEGNGPQQEEAFKLLDTLDG